MFTQLLGLLKDRAVTITASDAGEGKLRVCIVPLKKNDDENAALSAPLMIVGTAEEIDAGLPEAISSYVETYTPLNEQTERIRAEREQATKDDQTKADEERKARAAKNGKKVSTPTKPVPAKKPDPEVKKVAPPAETADLFATEASARLVSVAGPSNDDSADDSADDVEKVDADSGDDAGE